MEYLPYLSDLYKRVFREKLGRLGQEIVAANGVFPPIDRRVPLNCRPFPLILILSKQ